MRFSGRQVALFVLSALMLTGTYVSAGAQEKFDDSRFTDSLEVRVFFKVNLTEIDPDYLGNAENLRGFIDKFRTIQDDPSCSVNSFEIMCGASPEGYHYANIELSQKRGAALIRYLEDYVNLSTYDINIRSMGSDWQHLRDMVDSSDMPDRAAVLSIIDSGQKLGKVNGKDHDDRLIRLQRLNNGTAYNYMKTFMFPYLRESYAKIVCHYTKTINRIEPAPQGPALWAGDALVPGFIGMEPKARKIILAPRTNLLLPALNVGLEIPIGNRFSIGLDHYYPWLWRYWPTKSNKYCFETMWEQAEARVWFGENHTPGEKNYLKRFQGHSLAVFGNVGYYDLERNWSGHQGEFYTVGVDYLYAMPIANGKLHLEFDLGVGYFYSTARVYDVFEEGGKLFRRKGVTRETNYFGPIRAGVSLVIPIFMTYTPKKEVEQ